MIFFSYFKGVIIIPVWLIEAALYLKFMDMHMQIKSVSPTEKIYLQVKGFQHDIQWTSTIIKSVVTKPQP